MHHYLAHLLGIVEGILAPIERKPAIWVHNRIRIIKKADGYGTVLNIEEYSIVM